MVSKRLFYILAILLIIGVSSFSQPKTPVEPWFFIQITDPQLGMFDNNAGFEKETVLYEKAVASINKLNPEFVVITGDFVNDPKSVTQIKEFKRITAKINPKIPVYYTPGNHDLGQTPDKKSIKAYIKNYGNDQFSFKCNGSSFIGFNSSLIKANLTKSEQQQYNWLRKRLKESQGSSHLILFCHFPFFNHTVDEPNSYSNIDLGDREKYLDLFNSNKVEAIFSGHHHNNGLSTYGNMQLVTTSALGKPLGQAPSGMRIVKIYSNRIEHQYYGLEELPDSVIFH